MREFRLVIDGVSYPLNGGKALFTNPTGLGVKFANTLTDMGEGFGVLTNRKQSIGQICGDLVFFADATHTAYSQFKEFSDALLTASSVQFGYKPSTQEYLCDVTLTYLTKTESDKDRYIKIPSAFDMSSLWYTTETLSGTGTVNVTAGGQAETAVVVTTSSALTNPTLTITSGGETIASAAFPAYTTTGVFEYSNVPNDSYVYDSDSDIIGYVTIASNIFGRTRSAFSVNLSGAAMSVSVRKYWRTI